ncbi:MAG TPA: hypothetical protein VKS60_09005 [Stellaceae bacterium]|nr:hypothetical protein [Stellaceae bacterium]
MPDDSASADSIIARRRAAVTAAAEEAGLFEGERASVGARIPRRLLKAAKNRAGLGRTTAVIEYALAKVALEDDFIETLFSLEGSIPADLDLDF